MSLAISGEIPEVLVDPDGRQHTVFTPEQGGTFDGDSVALSAVPGIVPNGELIGLRMVKVSCSVHAVRMITT